MNWVEMVAISSAIVAILMVGSGQLRFNLQLYSVQTILIAATTAACAHVYRDSHLYLVAVVVLALKAFFLTGFLAWIIRKGETSNDPGTMVPIPIAMHLSILLFAVAYFTAKQLPHPILMPQETVGGAAAAVSLLFTGTLFMLTRKIAVSQILGFLTMENGIYLFALTQTKGMPMMIELGILLDVLVAVMIAGLIIFKIKKSFEHIDVSLLTELKD